MDVCVNEYVYVCGHVCVNVCISLSENVWVGMHANVHACGFCVHMCVSE